MEGGRWGMEGGWNEGNEGEDEEGGRALRGNRAGPQASDSGLSSQKPRRRGEGPPSSVLRSQRARERALRSPGTNALKGKGWEVGEDGAGGGKGVLQKCTQHAARRRRAAGWFPTGLDATIMLATPCFHGLEYSSSILHPIVHSLQLILRWL